MADELLAIAEKWWTPPPGIVAKLPRVTCSACSKKNCQDASHKPVRCSVCQAYISPRHIHLDFVGHADLTRALIEIDPEWQWEPVSFDEGGSPRIIQRGKMWVLWGRLTLLGKSMLCVGTCEVSDMKSDVDKELVGDMLRNGGMRFGIFGALWSKTDGWQDDDTTTNAPTNEGAVAIVRTEAGAGISNPTIAASLPPVAISQPDKPLAAMTMRELLAFATENAVSVSGSKSDIVRILEPLVRAASGEEPFELEGAEPLPVKEDVTDKPFTPSVADELRNRPPAVRASIRGSAE